MDGNKNPLIGVNILVKKGPPVRLYQSSLPLININVLAKESKVEVLTDSKGNYEIEVKPGQTLEFSFLGFKTAKREISNENQKINVVLEPLYLEPLESEPVEPELLEPELLEPELLEPELLEPELLEPEPVETELVETEPVETEPVETEPVETEPVETEPVETEPVETEPVDVQVKEPALVGSRNPNRISTDTPVPIDVIPFSDMQVGSPQVNINQILNYVAPSFTANIQNVSDGIAQIDPASLRGLGPDQVLLLINGKRRHTSSLVNVNKTTFGRGNVGTDMNAIPSIAIDRIEVLRDGATAQYGSDAIAGVINIVLKKTTNKLAVNVTSGANVGKYTNFQTGGLDGGKYNISANYGISIGEKGGYINFSGDFDARDWYSRMKEYEGSIFNGYNSIERVAKSEGINRNAIYPTDVRILSQKKGVGFSKEQIDRIKVATDQEIKKENGVLSFDNTENELKARKLSRTDFNMRVGQSALLGGRFFSNFSLPVSAKAELYAFAGFSKRKGIATGDYRLPNQVGTYTPMYFNGFLPETNSNIIDKSLALGIRGEIGEWEVDFSNVFGRSLFSYTIGNSSNASLGSKSPKSFDAGGFSFTQNTINLDAYKYYEDIFSGLNVAFGVVLMKENYKQVVGEEKLYGKYREYGTLSRESSQKGLKDFFGRERPDFSQGFPVYSPENEVSRDRNSLGGYIDLEADITENILLELVSRYERYSDFGNTLNFKLASRVKLSDHINLRVATSTGFRAPSLHQLYFSATSTMFKKGKPNNVSTFSNDSKIAKLLGIPKLKQETSKSVSAGITAKLSQENLSLSLDGFFIAVDNRVVYTDEFEAKKGTEVGNILKNAMANRVAFFANAIDTQTKGMEAVISHRLILGTSLNLNTDLSASFLKTNRVGDIHASPKLKKAGLVDTYFSEASRIFLEHAIPQTKGNLSFKLSSQKWSVFFRNAYFGSVIHASSKKEEQQVYGAKVVTDLALTYNIAKKLYLTVGSNNLFDIYPDKTDPTNPNYSDGRFVFSRTSLQFGIGGRFIFARLFLNL
ncbi:TonB-dependent receptor [Elysia marginata]|uniref:TonB-dependent receptor n=1 Tax=Elysia marginata TaxID=1093978 RepID=A0AAV4G6Q3_9GAST|nr:TonB-dependent receptor [Elysia marginata]